ncbi:MAG: AMP-binding protein, partial [Clostridiaceae bacterium]|nr:AMP-binding protein [Clostridiaceae bacterium]
MGRDIFQHIKFEIGITSKESGIINNLSTGADCFPDKIAIASVNKHITYRELEVRTDLLARFLISESKSGADISVGIYLSDPIDRAIAYIAALKAGTNCVFIETELSEHEIKSIIDDSKVRVLVSSKDFLGALNRLQWKCKSLDTYLCLESWDIKDEKEERNELSDKKIWDYVADSGKDSIEAGGWVSSYTGQKFSQLEMDEFSENILRKLEPYLNKDAKVLEIGCASGLGMYRIAPLVGMYYGTDLSESMIEWNKQKIKKEGIENIELMCLPAHEISRLDSKGFDIIIINSVIQYFDGYNYLKRVISDAIELCNNDGIIFIGDVRDLDSEADFIKSLADHQKDGSKNEYRAYIAQKNELFVSKAYFK